MPPPDSLVVIAGLLAALTAVAAAVGCLVVRGSTAVPAAGWAVAAAAAAGFRTIGVSPASIAMSASAVVLPAP